MEIRKEKLGFTKDRMRGSNIGQTGFLKENNENRKVVFVEIMAETLQNWLYR